VLSYHSKLIRGFDRGIQISRVAGANLRKNLQFILARYSLLVLFCDVAIQVSECPGSAAAD
jgi:hypothetical protein